MKNIDNGNIGLGMLNRSKLHLNTFGTIQLVKNYCENLKTWHHKEQPANENVPVLKPEYFEKIETGMGEGSCFM